MGQKEPTFVTLSLPEYISDQAVDLLSPILERFMTVFKGKHKFNGNNRNAKRHVKIFPVEWNPARLPRKIIFHDSIIRGVLFAEKNGVTP